MALLDLVNLKKVRRALLYLFLLLGALWLQFSLFSRIALPDFGLAGGGGVKPFFLPVFAAAIGLWEGGVWGGVFGLGLGIYCDLNLAESTVLFLLLLSAAGFFSGVLADFLVNRRLVAFLLLSAATLLLCALCQIVPLWLFRGAALPALLPVAALQALWSLPFAVPAYLAAKAISRAGQDAVA